MEIKRNQTLGERVFTWAKSLGILLPILGAATVSVMGWFKSDDAQSDIDSLIQHLSERVGKQERVINFQSEKLEKMARRIVFFQAHQEGVSAGRLTVKVEETEAKLSECLTARAKRVRARKDELEDLIGSALGKGGGGAPETAKADTVQQVQTIPRIKSKPFKRAD